jgi:hypothetical protein
MHMRNLIITFCLICPGIFFNAEAKPSSLVPVSTTVNNDPLPYNSKSFAKILSMNAKDVEKIIGRKLSLTEKITFKIAKWKAKKFLNEGEPTERQRKQGTLSLIFGATGLLFTFIFFPVGIALAIAGLVLGIKSIKGNGNVPALLGIIFSSVAIFILLLALAFVASWGWY